VRTADERQKDFIADLQLLLKRHGAELQVGDDGAAYGMAQGEVSICMDGVYIDDKLKSEFCEFILPSYMDGDDG